MAQSTNWEQHIRHAEATWIDENAGTLSAYAREQYEEIGRGAVYIDTSEMDSEGAHPLTYLSQAVIEEEGDEELMAALSEYDPMIELIIIRVSKQPPYSLHSITHLPAKKMSE